MIKPDAWIKRKSNVQTPALFDNDGRLIAFKANEPLWTLPEEEARGFQRRLARNPELCMIEPFLEKSVKLVNDIKIISKGVSSYGYDVTLSDKGLKLFTDSNACGGDVPMVINPKAMDSRLFVEPEIRFSVEFGHYVMLPPHSYLLGHTVEFFRIPRNVLVICLGKSTYARGAIAVNVTPIEPEFEGNVVIEISNLTGLPVMVYVNEGVAQFCFFESDEACEVSYKDRDGKYQGQLGTVDAKV